MVVSTVTFVIHQIWFLVAAVVDDVDLGHNHLHHVSNLDGFYQRLPFACCFLLLKHLLIDHWDLTYETHQKKLVAVTVFGSQKVY